MIRLTGNRQRWRVVVERLKRWLQHGASEAKKHIANRVFGCEWVFSKQCRDIFG